MGKGEFKVKNDILIIKLKSNENLGVLNKEIKDN
jgi:hypothetical protein